MQSDQKHFLTINGGSSSIKFAVYKFDEQLTLQLSGQIEGLGNGKATLSFNDACTGEKQSMHIPVSGQKHLEAFLIDWLEKQQNFDSIKAIGHRIVHGMKHTGPEVITDALLNELKAISVYDPDHLPAEIQIIELFKKRYPAITQVACFDTSFHTSMPPVAKLLAIPRKYQAMGVQRYGFHGLSYAFLMEELKRIAGEEVSNGKIILAHLGSGASLAAVKGGKSMDTSMGFTPVSGLPMSTRTGDMDAGLAGYLMQVEKLSAQAFNQLINHQSGLLGISETSGDMRELLKKQGTDNRAAEAVELFCYQTRKWIGSFAAVLGGLETLVFAGGIGENSPEVRQRICNNLQFLGLELDKDRNANNERIISADSGKVTVFVIHTNEELMIAKLVNDILNNQGKI